MDFKVKILKIKMETCDSCLGEAQLVYHPCLDTKLCAECWISVFNRRRLEIARCPLCLEYMLDWLMPHRKSEKPRMS